MLLIWIRKPYLLLMDSLMIAGASTFRFLGAGPLANWGESSASDGLVGGAGVTVPGTGTLSSHESVVACGCPLSTFVSVGTGATVWESGREVGVCADGVIGVWAIWTGSTVSESDGSDSEVQDCVIICSGRPAGMPSCSFGLSPGSSSLQTVWFWNWYHKWIKRMLVVTS